MKEERLQKGIGVNMIQFSVASFAVYYAHIFKIILKRNIRMSLMFCELLKWKENWKMRQVMVLKRILKHKYKPVRAFCDMMVITFITRKLSTAENVNYLFKEKHVERKHLNTVTMDPVQTVFYGCILTAVFKHTKRIVQDNRMVQLWSLEQKKTMKVVLSQALIGIGPNNIHNSCPLVKKHVLSIMLNDEFSRLVKADKLIIELGEIWMVKSYGNKLARNKTSSFRIRLCARLLENVRILTGIPDLAVTDICL